MASTTLYPPLVDSTSDAFISNGKCRIYYSLSKYSSSASGSIKSIHISVIRQSSGISAVNKTNSQTRYRNAGIIILNTSPTPANKKGLYYIDILPEDIAGGWTEGAIYKIQLRLSSVQYNGTDGMEAWLNINAGYFSEWSTYCTTKAISRPVVNIIPFNYTNIASLGINESKFYSITTSTINFTGIYSNTDMSENLYSYNLKLYDTDNTLIEDSGVIYPGQYENFNKINYIIKREFKDSENWKIIFTYTTTNMYSERFSFNFSVSLNDLKNDIKIITIDELGNKPTHSLHIDNNKTEEKKVTLDSSIAEEEEQGRIALKLYSEEKDDKFYGNIYIRRTDSKTNFERWEDFTIVSVEYPGKSLSELDIIYDNTIESGVWYKYGVQTSIYVDGARTVLNEIKNPILREFEYNFLIGENGKQLKLPFNSEMNSYAYTLMEGKNDPISGQFPIITRNAKLKYRTFPLSALISFHMDDMRLFLTKEELYKYQEIEKLYAARNTQYYYDYIQERLFREEVLDFLQDGKPKLFKSNTEGNIIVRLLNVSESPNKTLNRMIGSVSMTAYEIANDSIDNYKKYSFISTMEPIEKFVSYEYKMGQCVIDQVYTTTDIIDAIFDKYNYSSTPIDGKRYTLSSISDLKIEIDGQPLIFKNDVIGYELITPNGVLNIPDCVYSFGKEIIFDKNSNLFVSNQQIETSVGVTASFICEYMCEDWVDRELLSLSYIDNLGQLFQQFDNSDSQPSAYDIIVNKHSYEYRNILQKVEKITWCSIECQPGTAIVIQNSIDGEGTQVIMNGTGRLDLSGLGDIYNIKIVVPKEPKENPPITAVINYIYTVRQETYKEE